MSRLGLLSVAAAVILGQMMGSLVLDVVGAFGLPVRALSPTPVLPVLLVASGVVLLRL